MFGKLLLLVIVIAALFVGWRWYSRIAAIGQDRLNARKAPRPTTQPRGPTGVGRSADPKAEDMEKCPECGAYVAPRSAVSCGQAACPYG